MRRRNHYKFTEKKHSKRGMLACFLAAASIFVLVWLFIISFRQDGNGSVYLGSAGILALFIAAAAFVQAVKSMREEDTFRRIPVSSVILSLLAAGLWIGVYVIGFLL